MHRHLSQTHLYQTPQVSEDLRGLFGDLRVLGPWLTIALCLVVVTGCQLLPEETPAAPTATATVVATPLPTPTVVPADHFQNPVLRADFPDPGIIRVDDTYYAYSTNSAGKNVPVARSTDLVRWEVLPDAMPGLAPWVRLSNPHVWAPEVIEIDGRYLLYYTARDRASDRQCLGVAVSDRPQGGFRDTSERPFICQVEEGGSIDASPFHDEDGTLYLYWKNDGNCCMLPTYIYVQEMTPDGLGLVGEPTRLVRNDRSWEGRVVEAPTMWRHEESYYLFFSGNNYAGIEYAVGYAFCETAVGPCEDAPENPILSSVMTQSPPVVGPGHQTIVVDDNGDTWLVYHAWEITSAGRRGDRRFMWIDRLLWEEGPVVQGPTVDPQPAPEAGQ